MLDRPSSESLTLTKFGDVVREVTEHDRTPVENGLERYVGLEHLDPHSLKIKRWGLLSEGTTFTKRFRAGQVLFGRRRAYQRKAAVPDFDGICSSDILIFEAKQEYLLPELLPFLVHTDAFFDYALGTSSGSLSPRTKWSHLAAFKFYLPPIARQKELVELFQAIEDAIAATEESIAAAEQLKRSLMHELLTKGIGHTEFKQTCLGKIPTDWEIYHLPEVASYQNGKAFPSEEYGEYGVHLLRPGNMHEDGSLCWDKARTICLPERWVDLASDYVVQENELVMNLTAQSLEDEFLGRVCLTQEGTFCLLNQRIARIRDRNCHLPFLFWCLKGSYIRAQIDSISNGMKVKHIYNSNLNALKLPVPTSLDEQETIAKILSNQQKIIGAAQRHCKNLSLLKHQLVNGSLSGQCDEIYTKLRRELVGV